MNQVTARIFGAISKSEIIDIVISVIDDSANSSVEASRALSEIASAFAESAFECLSARTKNTDTEAVRALDSAEALMRGMVLRGEDA